MTLEDRGQFLLDYIDLLLNERVDEARELTHDRWVINKLRALGSWYTKGLENGSHLRTGINSAQSLRRSAQLIAEFFGVGQARQRLTRSLRAYLFYCTLYFS